MKRAGYLFAVILVLVAASPVPAADLTLLTRNLYLGADLMPIAAATSQAEFFAAAQAALGQIAANNFPERVAALAEEIAERQPHLVGLQEVYDFTLNGQNGPPPFRDYLADLRAALAGRGADYQVAAIVRNLDLAVTLPGFGTVGVVDRDVILRRADVTTAVVPLSSSCARPSVDGCNYLYVASFPSPVGEVAFERGYVAVSAFIDGQPFVVVNTHLEQRLPDFPELALVQYAQGLELVQVSLGLEVFGAPVIVLGDFNSSPEHEIVVVGGVRAVPPYALFVGAEYADAWLLRPGKSPGLTCCELPDLSNPIPVLTERVDLIFSSVVPLDVKANVLGNEPSDKTRPLRLWPSDHAGVVATLDLPF